MALQLKARPTLRIKIIACVLAVFSFATPLSLNVYTSVHALGADEVTINEFSSFTSSDWVELYNPTQQPVTMVNWTLRDSSATQLKLINGTLAPQGFRAIDFSDYLNKTGDTIKLYDTLGMLVDEVAYAENGPVPASGSAELTTSRTSDGGPSWTTGEATKGSTNTPDRQAPTATLLQPGAGEFFGGNDRAEILARAQFADNKNLKSFHMSVNGTETAQLKPEGKPSVNPEGGVSVIARGEVSTSALPEGVHTITIAVWATDETGNSSVKAEVDVVVDKTTPTVTVTSPVFGQTIGGEELVLLGSVGDSGSGLQSYHYQLLDKDKNALPGREGSGSQAVEAGQLGVIDIAGLESGSYYIGVWAIDNASNTSTVVDLAISIDHTPPGVTVNLTSSPNPTASTPIQLQGAAGEEAIASLILYVEDNDGNRVMTRDIITQLSGGQWRYVLTEGLSQGSYSIFVVATDHYGNASTTKSSPLSVMSLAVGAYVPPANSAISGGLTANLSNPFFVPAAVVPVTVPETRSEEASDVLGSQDEQSSEGQADKVAVAATESGWRLFGILWYWWLLGGGVAAGAWWTFSLAKRHMAEEAL